MPTPHRQHSRRRPGFTLVELLVVVTIILVLAGIAVLFVPSLADKQRASEGASQFQGWLLIAKQKALRDQGPRGIRLTPNMGKLPQYPAHYVTDLQYIEQPPDFTGGLVNQFLPNNMVSFTGVDFYGGFGPTDPTLWPVQPGDYLEIKGGGSVSRIQAVGQTTLTLVSTPVVVNTPTWQYRIIRQARILAGEDELQMPQNVAIDLKLSRAGSQVNVFSGQPIDILFSPSGTVIGQVAAYDKLALWVKDTTLADTEGEPTLIAVFSRTGLLASYPVDLNSTNPYSYLDDGRYAGP
jgi:prepilin-type N-terminal cleavage/methylation domain-containing protein